MKLVLDLDSTLADFMDPWYVWLKRKGYTDVIHSSEEVVSYDWLHTKYGQSVSEYFLKDPVYLYKNNILPIPGSAEFVKWCLDHFSHVEILTHASTKETEKAKCWWVKNYLDFDNIRFFETLDDKFKHLDDVVLVDDYPKHLILHNKHNNGKGVLFDWNGSYGWSKMENYDLEGVNTEHIKQARNYYEVMKLLMELKHE